MRTTDDKKESTIILRVNDDMRSYLEKCAQKESVKLSAYVREVIEKSQKGIKCNTKYDSNVQDSLDDIESMVKSSGGTFDKFISRLQTQLFWGELLLNDGELATKEPSGLDIVIHDEEVQNKMADFEKFCRDCLVEAPRAYKQALIKGMEVVTEGMRRGNIV